MQLHAYCLYTATLLLCVCVRVRVHVRVRVLVRGAGGNDYACTKNDTPPTFTTLALDGERTYTALFFL